MTMTQALYEIAPNTTKMFASWLMEGYGLSLPEFEKATPKRKFFEVSRYFGYPLEDNTQLPVSDIIVFIKEKFAEYEAIMIKYPDGVPNPLLAIKEMNHTDREVWLSKHFTRMINISLQHALVDGNNLIRISLKDSIKDRQLNAIERAAKFNKEHQIAEEKFWQDIIKNFDPQAVPPF
jgi:hypothetical protein